MLLLAFAMAYLGMTLLCLAMNRHRGVLLRADTHLLGIRGLRTLAAGGFGVALWLCIASEGGEMGGLSGFAW